MARTAPTVTSEPLRTDERSPYDAPFVRAQCLEAATTDTVRAEAATLPSTASRRRASPDLRRTVPRAASGEPPATSSAW